MSSISFQKPHGEPAVQSPSVWPALVDHCGRSPRWFRGVWQCGDGFVESEARGAYTRRNQTRVREGQRTQQSHSLCDGNARR
jgi:hypothetical protein